MKLFALLLIMLISTPHQEDITGKWKTPKENSIVEIKKNGAIWEGVVIKSDNEKAIGQKVLQDLKKDGSAWKGKVYAIEKDKLLDVEIELDENVLELTVKSGWMSKTSEWQKVD